MSFFTGLVRVLSWGLVKPREGALCWLSEAYDAPQTKLPHSHISPHLRLMLYIGSTPRRGAGGLEITERMRALMTEARASLAPRRVFTSSAPTARAPWPPPSPRD